MTQPAPAQPPVPPQPQQPVPPAGVAPSQSNGFAITALVLGIVAFLFGWAGFFNLLTAVLAVVFGIVALVKRQSKGMAITGTALGGVGLLTSILVGLFFTAAIIEGARNGDLQQSTPSTESSLFDSYE